MAKRSKWRGNRCALCGTPCAPYVDNHGQRYMGCPRCIITLPPETP